MAKIGLVEIHADSCRVWVDDQVRTASSAEEAADELRSEGVRRVIVALSRDDCLTASVRVRRRGRLRRDSVGFALEDHLPQSIERYVFDYVDTGEEVFAGSVGRERLSARLEAFDDLQIIACTSFELLIAQGLSLHTDRQRQVILFPSRGRTHLVELDERRRIAWWSSCLADIDPTGTLAARWLETQSAHVAASACNAVFLGNLAEVMDVRVLESSVEDTLRSMLRSLSTGRVQPWIDLRSTGARSGGHTKPLAGAAVVCLMVLGSLCYARSRDHAEQVDTFRQQQQDLFARVFPGERIPTGILRRFESAVIEKSRLSGDEGQLPDIKNVPEQVITVLNALPGDLRFRVRHIHLDGDIINLDGEVRSGSDGVRLANALRSSGLEVLSPSIEQATPRTVNFRIALTAPGEGQP